MALTRRAKLARIAQYAFFSVVGLGVVSAGVGLALALSGASEAGLSAADKQRIIANGVAESVYNAAFALVGAAPLLAVWLIARRAPPDTTAR